MANASAATQAAVEASPKLIPPVFHAIGGSLGSAFALFLLYPLERARIEMQKNVSDNTGGLGKPVEKKRIPKRNKSSPQKSELSEDESWESLELTDSDEAASDIVAHAKLAVCVNRLWRNNELYRGVGPLVFTLAVSNFVFFYVNEFVKRMILHQPTKAAQPRTASNSYRSLLASCLAGICNVLLTNPLWVANLRIVTGESATARLIHEMLHVARISGLRQLWSGTGASLLLVSNPVLQFFLYEELKILQTGNGRARLNASSAFATGAAAKAAATVLTYPLQLTQTLLRMQSNSAREDEYRGSWDCLVKVFNREGVCGLFTGMKAKLLQTVLTAAFTFLTYEQIVAALHSTHQAFLIRRTHKQLIR